MITKNSKISFYFTVAILLFVGGCAKRAEYSESTSNSEFHVERLFNTDGCTVYRFYDSGYPRYFTKCENSSSSTQWNESCGKNCSRSVEVPNEN